MSDTEFTKRVHLLEYWAPSLLSKLEDLDDLADCILSVWDTAEQHTEERIIKLLEANFHRFDLSNNGVDYPMGLEQFIELIKGENK